MAAVLAQAEALPQQGGDLDRERHSVMVRVKEQADSQAPTQGPGGEGGSNILPTVPGGQSVGGLSQMAVLTESGPGSMSLELEGRSRIENPAAGSVGYDWEGMQNVFKVHAQAPDTVTGLPRESHGTTRDPADGSSGATRAVLAPPEGAAPAGHPNPWVARRIHAWPVVPSKGSISTLAPRAPGVVPRGRGRLAVASEGPTAVRLPSDGAAPTSDDRGHPSDALADTHWYPQGLPSPLRNPVSGAGQDASQRESNSFLVASRGEEVALDRDEKTDGARRRSFETAPGGCHASQGGTEGSHGDRGAHWLSLSLSEAEGPVAVPQPAQLEIGSLVGSAASQVPGADSGVQQVGVSGICVPSPFPVLLPPTWPLIPLGVFIPARLERYCKLGTTPTALL